MEEIKPSDIRPGDRFLLTYEATCERIDRHGIIVATNGYTFDPRVDGHGTTWHLVSRPDPEAEARACAWAEYREDYAPNPPALGAAHRAFLAGWEAAREQGWDVRRAES